MIPKHKKLSKAQKRDFIAYCRGMRNIKVGRAKPLTTTEHATCLAHWFVLWDTHGIYADYKNLKLCWRLIQAKEQLNLTIDLWIEDLLGGQPVQGAYEIWEWCQDMPSWVWKSFVNSFRNRSKGIYVPTYYDPQKIKTGE